MSLRTKNKADETEKLSADDKKTSPMLGGLKKVSAPKNFDFQLKARIATRSRARFAPTRSFAVFALRAAFKRDVLLAGFVFFNLSFSTENQKRACDRRYYAENSNETVPPAEVVKPSINESLATSTNTDKNSQGKTNVPEIVNLTKKNVEEKPNTSRRFRPLTKERIGNNPKLMAAALWTEL